MLEQLHLIYKTKSTINVFKAIKCFCVKYLYVSKMLYFIEKSFKNHQS